MSTKKFNEAEAKYKKTKQWKFIGYMFQQASSYDDYKKVAQYIIDSGVYKPGMPENINHYQREDNWLIQNKFSLLADVLGKYRVACKTEQQLLEYIHLSLANDLWRAYHSYHIDTAPDRKAIHALKDVATTFDAFYFLYLYDYYDAEKTTAYLQQLEALATTAEQIKQIEDTIKVVKEKVKRLDELD
jgi:hypothetical protein